VVVGQPQGKLDVKDVEQLDEVVGPAGADCAGSHGVFQREVPADDPGNQFAQRGVGVGVCGAGERDHGGKLRVTEAGEGAAQPAENEGEHQARTGVVRTQARHDEDARGR